MVPNNKWKILTPLKFFYTSNYSLCIPTIVVLIVHMCKNNGNNYILEFPAHSRITYLLKLNAHLFFIIYRWSRSNIYLLCEGSEIMNIVIIEARITHEGNTCGSSHQRSRSSYPRRHDLWFITPRRDYLWFVSLQRDYCGLSLTDEDTTYSRFKHDGKRMFVHYII